MILRSCIDPFITNESFSATTIFLFRTALYWSIFAALSKIFPQTQQPTSIIKKIVSASYWFPLIPLATGAALGMIGQTHLIVPLVQIILGTFFMILGRISAPIVTLIAWSLVAGGLIGIYWSPVIDSLWMYLLIYQGFLFVIMGAILHKEQK